MKGLFCWILLGAILVDRGFCVPAATEAPEEEDDPDWDDDDDSSEADDDGRVYKNPRNSPSTECPRDEEQATLLGQKCLRKCSSDEDCKSKKKKCLCDGACGMSCIKPDRECPELTQPALGTVTLSGRHFGGRATYTCPHGYHVVGLQSRLCQADGHWAGTEPACKMNIYCLTPPTIEHARHSALPEQATFDLDSTVQYHCHTGYVTNGFPRAKCLAIDGQASWYGPDISCEPRSCGQPPDPAHGWHAGECYTFGCRVTYHCGDGYELVGKQERFCQADGSWIPKELPTCVLVTAVQCPGPENPKNGKAIYTSTSYNSVVSYECRYGYTLVGESSRRCGADRKWSGSLPVCKEINCGHPGSLYNGWLENIESGTGLGASIIFRCHPGMLLQGNTSTVCQIDGRWRYAVPQCLAPCVVPTISQGQVIPIETYEPDSNVTTPFPAIPTGPISKVEHGTVLEVICDDYFEFPLSALSSPTCNNGTWSVIPRCVPARCKTMPRPPKHGMVLAPKTEHGMKARFKCKDGFNLTAPIGKEMMDLSYFVLTCSFGNWTGETPACKEVYCSFPGYIANGKVLLVGNMGLYDYRPYVKKIVNNKQIMYDCDKGYVLGEGPPGATCVGGLWRPTELPQCLPGQHPRIRWNRRRRSIPLEMRFKRTQYLLRYYKYLGDHFMPEPRTQPATIPASDSSDGGPQKYLSRRKREIAVRFRSSQLSRRRRHTRDEYYAKIKQKYSDYVHNLLTYQRVRAAAKADMMAVSQRTASVNRQHSVNRPLDVVAMSANASQIVRRKRSAKGNDQERRKPKGQRRVNQTAVVGEEDEEDGSVLSSGKGARRGNGKGKVPCTPLSGTSASNLLVEIVRPGRDQSNAFATGTIVRVECAKGFTLNLPHANSTAKCVRGRWKPMQPECMIMPCKIPVTEHGSYYAMAAAAEALPVGAVAQVVAPTAATLALAGATEIQNGDAVSFQCADGFNIQGASELQCDASNWTPSALPECLPSPCVLPPISHAVYQGGYRAGLTIAHGSSVTVQCENTGDNIPIQMDCSLGALSPKTVACGTASRRLRQDANAEGSAESSQESDETDGGNASEDESGEHDCGPPARVQGSLVYRNGEPVSDGESGFPSGTEVLFNCISSSAGERTTWKIICEDGSWIGRSLNCANGTCLFRNNEPHVVSFYNDLEIREEVVEFPPGATIISRCVDIGKYSMTGSSMRTCIHSEWNGPKPVCFGLNQENDYAMEKPPTILFRHQNGPIAQSNDGKLIVYPGTTVHMECLWMRRFGNPKWNVSHDYRKYPEGWVTDEGRDAQLEFRLSIFHAVEDDSGVFTCQTPARHEHSFEVVVKPVNCPEIPTRRGLTTSSGDTKMTSKIHLSCANGNSLIGATELQCLPSGNWSGPLPVCESVECGDIPLASITNGTVPRVAVLSREVGGRAAFSCSLGYGLRGPSESVCLPTGEWAQPFPTCVEVQCDSPGAPQNGYAQGSAPYRAGDVVQFNCNPEYMMQGQPIIACQDNGRWSGGLPKCVQACSYPGTAISGRMSSVKFYYAIGESVTFTCDAGLDLRGAKMLKCLRNGKWSNAIPTCVNADTLNTKSDSKMMFRRQVVGLNERKHVHDAEPTHRRQHYKTNFNNLISTGHQRREHMSQHNTHNFNGKSYFVDLVDSLQRKV